MKQDALTQTSAAVGEDKMLDLAEKMSDSFVSAGSFSSSEIRETYAALQNFYEGLAIAVTTGTDASITKVQVQQGGTVEQVIFMMDEALKVRERLTQHIQFVRDSVEDGLNANAADFHIE